MRAPHARRCLSAPCSLSGAVASTLVRDRHPVACTRAKPAPSWMRQPIRRPVRRSGRAPGAGVADGSTSVVRTSESGRTCRDARDLGEAAAIAVDHNGVYWLDTGHPNVDCTPTDGALEYLAMGSDSPVVLASKLEGARSLTLWGGAAYFSTIGAFCNGAGGPVGSIFRTSSPTASVEALASKLPSPSDLYVDTDGVSFTVVTDTSNWVVKPAMTAR